MNCNKIIRSGFRYIFNSNYRFLMNLSLGFYDRVEDEVIVRKTYKAVLGKELNLDTPKTFNEKLQWLKLYNRKPEYTMMADKFLVREYIKQEIGEQYLVPLLGVWDDPDEIDFDKLPDRFVLKCNHNSGLGMCICKDKSKLNIPKVKAELKKGLKQDYYLAGREWPYKDIPRRIICEAYLEDATGELVDYKFMCFRGEVKCSFVCSGRFSDGGLHMTYFDRDWNRLPIERHYPSLPGGFPKPENYEKMVQIAEHLSRDLPFVRVDFYEAAGKLYFGELTFYPANGLSEYTPSVWNETLGDWLKLPELR